MGNANNSGYGIDDYKEFLKIDRDDLKNCLIEQAQYFMEVATELSFARSEYLTAKNELDTLEKSVSLEVRNYLIENGQKITEKLIGDHISEDKRVKEYSKYLIECKQTLDQWESLREAFVQRSLMLKELARIYVNEYRITSDGLYDVRVKRGNRNG